MTAGAGCCRLLGLLYLAAVPQLPTVITLSVPPVSLPGGMRPVREPSRSAVKGGGHKGPREPPRDYVAGRRPHPPHHLANTLSKSVGVSRGRVQGRSPAFTVGWSPVTRCSWTAADAPTFPAATRTRCTAACTSLPSFPETRRYFPGIGIQLIRVRRCRRSSVRIMCTAPLISISGAC